MSDVNRFAAAPATGRDADGGFGAGWCGLGGLFAADLADALTGDLAGDLTGRAGGRLPLEREEGDRITEPWRCRERILFTKLIDQNRENRPAFSKIQSFY
ncbi:hypothetical protein [Thermoleptolyngbya sp.]